MSIASPSTLVIMNPAAGRAVDSALFASDVRQRLDCRVTTTRAPGDARACAERAVEAGVATVVAAGGDGTIREVATGLIEAGESAAATPTLGILPLGTGNDLARSLDIPLDLDGALDVITTTGRTRSLDLLRIRHDGATEWAVNAVVVGNGARVGAVLDADEKAFWGPLSYLRSAVRLALELEPVPVWFQIDDTRPCVETVMNIVIANGRSAAGGVPIAPRASPFDGRMDIAVVDACELTDALGIGAALARNTDPPSPHFHAYSARRISVRSENGPLPLSVDGETGAVSNFSIELVPGRLPVRRCAE